MKELISKLQNPSKEYRAVPFWSWNDKLDPEFLRWQIQQMDKAGLGGYFMHARGGLQTEYLSEEWMQCINTCIEEGNKLGMYSWCYDEEGWPSGFAGGMVTDMGDKFHVRWLEIEEIEDTAIELNEQILGIYMMDVQTKNIQRCQLEQIDFETGKDQRYFVIRHQSNPYYIDILNQDVVKVFIESTYEKYYSQFKEQFGKGMPGFFTDEPQYSRSQIPWSYIIPEEFKKRTGYDILDVLPALFNECEHYEKVRYDFWSLVSELYVTSFGKQIFDWCNEHGCQLTGHVMMEDNLYCQMGATAGVMPFYEYMHIPGMDWLGRNIESPVIPKQVSSVANQLGKKFVLSETFALCGWDVSFEELKWIAEWQYVNGVSLMCQHLEGYTLRGLRKRDYPPSLFYQQSWWEEYKVFNDYFARLGVLLTSEKSVADVLLLHPMKSGWITYDGINNEKLQKLDKDFVSTTEALAALHIDHHYGDETIINKYGRVEGEKFVVGQCEYKVVVIPSMLTIDENTILLLNTFINNGGKVISIGDLPVLCNGIPDKRMNELKKRVVCVEPDETRDKLQLLMEQMELPVISISDGNGEIDCIHYQQRDLGDMQVFYLVNHDQNRTFDATITIKGKGYIQKYEAENAEAKAIYSVQQDNCTKVELQFLPMQSYVLMFDRKNTESFDADNKEIMKIQPKAEWNIEEMDLNSLTLDYCHYSIDGGEWLGPVPVIKLMDILLNLKRSCEIFLKYNFKVDMHLNENKEFFLAVETADEFEMYVNGKRINYQEQGWWKDSAFKKVDIRPYVKVGMNEVILKRDFWQAQKVYDVLFGENVLETEINKLTYDVELESIYVVGDFGVVSKTEYSYGERKAVFTDGPFVIVDKTENIADGNLTGQGFCFFAGAIKLSQKIQLENIKEKKIILQFKRPNAVLTKVIVNNHTVKALPWAPYDVDITDFVHEGDNKIIIQLFAGNRNLLGPHHHVGGEVYQVGPSSFTDKAGWADEEVTNIWRDRYCFVKFGLNE